MSRSQYIPSLKTVNSSGLADFNNVIVFDGDPGVGASFRTLVDILKALDGQKAELWVITDATLDEDLSGTYDLSGVTVVIKPGVTVTASVAQTINFNVKVQDGGQFTIDENVTVNGNLISEGYNSGIVAFDAVTGDETLTINGAIDAGLWQVFGSSLTVAGTLIVKDLYVSWFGKDANAIQSVFDILSDSSGYIAYLDNLGTLEINQTITGINFNSHKIYRLGDTILKHGNFNGNLFEIEGIKWSTISLEVDGNADNRDNRNRVIGLLAAENCTIYKTYIYDASHAPIHMSQDSSGNICYDNYITSSTFLRTGRDKYDKTSAHITYYGTRLWLNDNYFGEVNDNAVFLNPNVSVPHVVYAHNNILDNVRVGLASASDWEHFYIDGVEVYGSTGKVYKQSEGSAKNVTVRNVTVEADAYGNFKQVVDCDPDSTIENLEISGCRVNNNVVWLATLNGVTNLFMHDNIVENPQRGLAILGTEISNFSIYNNICINPNQSGDNQSAFDFRSSSDLPLKKGHIYNNKIIDNQSTPTIYDGFRNNEYNEDIYFYNNLVIVENGSPQNNYYDLDHTGLFSWNNIPRRRGAELVSESVTVNAGAQETVYSSSSENGGLRVLVYPRDASGTGIVTVAYTHDGTNLKVVLREVGGSNSLNCWVDVERIGRFVT